MRIKKVKINNIQDLLNDLSQVYTDLRSGVSKPSEVKEINNTAGKIIGSCKLSIEYSVARKEVPDVPFLNVPRA